MERGCQCQEIRERLKAKGCKWTPPEVDGHIFFIGREYQGPWAKALNTNSANIPTPTRWDAERAWEYIYRQIPEGACCEPVWKLKFKECYMVGKEKKSATVPSTRDVYMLRKLLKGMIIGPIDKNNGESSVCCPVLYHKALENLHTEETGYQEIYPRKAT